MTMPLFRKVECVRFYVDNLEAGLAFYCDQLGHQLIWRTETAAGLRLPDQRQEVNFLVDSADRAAQFIEQAGGVVIVPPFDIQIGRCAVVEDPWGNPLVLLDTSKGLLKTDSDGNVIGNLNSYLSE
jgi:lactoylglutathione lyase